MKTALVALAAALTAATGVAVAQDTGAQSTGAGPRSPMMRADLNGDGVITRQEMMDEAGRRFDRLDANHDGKLDATELASMRGGRGYGRMGGDMPPPPPPAGAPRPQN